MIRDGGIRGVVIVLGRSFTRIKELPNGNLVVGAGCLNYNLAQFAMINSIKGFEFLIGIPGTIGGGVMMNAGAYGSEFKDLIIGVEVLDKVGNHKYYSSDEIGFKYRKNSLPQDSIFTQVIFKREKGVENNIRSKMSKIKKIRFSTQPITKKTAGSIFRNSKDYRAWKLIDQVGLRGYSVGGASVSTKHCNFMINDGTASALDIEKLGNFIQIKVYHLLGIKLQWEIHRLGRLCRH